MENKEISQKFDKLVGVLKSVSLTDVEKSTIKESLLKAANESFVRKAPVGRLIYTRSLLTNIFFKRMPIALAIAMFFGGGVSFAAESSLPGSFLYPVKTEVNERVGEVLSFSTEAKAKFEAKLANRRAEEAEKLAEKGEMSPERAAKLKVKFELHADKVRERLNKLEANGKLEAAIEANSDLHEHLGARIKAMMNIAEKNGDESEKAEMRNWLMNIRDEDGKFGDAQLRMENKIKLDVSANVEARAEGKLKASENKIAEVTKFIANHKASVSADVSVKAEAQLNVANRLVAEGKVKLEAKAYGEAFVLFHKAHVAAMEAQRIMINGREKARLLNLGIKADIKIGREKDEKAKDEQGDIEDENESSVSGESRTKVNSGNSGTRADTKLKIEI